MKWLQFILSHSIFISFCAAALCFQTFQLLHVEQDAFIYLVVFSSTLAGYNFYWLISKYYFSNREVIPFLYRNFSNVLVLIIAALFTVYALFHVAHVLPQLLVAGLFTILYSVPLWPVKGIEFLRKAGYIKTILLAITWAYATVIIPIAGKGVDPDAVWVLFTARFFFMLMLCTIFDSRDSRVDRIRGLGSLATTVSPQLLRVIMAVVFVLFLAAGIALRLVFSTDRQVLAFLVSGFATLYVYYLSGRRRGYYFYYFGVDGLMLFSALATYVASID